MALRSASIAIVFVVVLLTTSAVHLPVAAVKGPRSDDMTIYYYADMESAYAALTVRDIDAVGYELTADLYVNATADPSIVVGPVADAGFYQVDINNNYTMPEYPGIESPTYRVEMRQAIAYLTPKDRIVSECCAGFACRIDQPLAYALRGWRNQSCWYEDGTYPYEYNSSAAAAVLDAGGFRQGNTTNPDYDPLYPGSAEYLRTYPLDHPQKPGQDLDPLQVYVRSDDLRRLLAGRLLDENLRKLGVPTDRHEFWHPGWPPTDTGDFHLYTGGWSVGRFPGVTLYEFYHSSGYYPYGPNYVTGVNATGDPNYQHLDALLEAARFPDTYEEAVAATKLAAGYMTELCITIPLFSAKAYWAWRTDLLGLVNMAGVGPENGYTFLNAYKLDGSAIRYGLKTAPVALNIFYSMWYYDYQNLDRMNLYGGFDTPPYDLSLDQPAFATTRLVDTWDDGGTTKTKITYTYRPDGSFVEPVTGNQLANVNASHVYASIWYHFQLGDGWHYTDVEEVHHLNLTGPNTVDIYFDSYSYWHAYAAQPPIMSFHLLRQGTLSAVRAESISFTGPGYLGLTYKPFWVTSISGLGGLVQGTDWEIVRVAGGHADVYIYKAGTGTVDITYYSAEDATGFTPGNLPYPDCFEGAGPWYAITFTLHGSLRLRKNPFYYVDTPLLGEIDWVRKSNGCYKLDIYDVVKAAGAYGSQATGVPSTNWVAGADFAPAGGKIDIFDIVTITGPYGQEFDLPP
jgi:hypothetical protein